EVLGEAEGGRVGEGQQLAYHRPDAGTGELRLVSGDEDRVLHDPGRVQYQRHTAPAPRVADRPQVGHGHRVPAAGVAAELDADEGRTAVGLGQPGAEVREVDVALEERVGTGSAVPDTGHRDRCEAGVSEV